MQNIIFISIGGVVGALSRYFVSHISSSHTILGIKSSTIYVNIIGSFIIGFFWGLSEQINIEEKYKHLITTGFLGCFTTFSAFSLENLNYMLSGEFNKALLNLLISNILGISMAFAGYFVVKWLKS